MTGLSLLTQHFWDK